MSVIHHPNLVADGLVVYFDAANRASHPGTGTTWTDLVGGYIGTLKNIGGEPSGPNFNSDNGGSIAFDGTNDYVQTSAPSPDGTGGFTIEFWAKFDDANNTDCMFSNYMTNHCQLVIQSNEDFHVMLGNSVAFDLPTSIVIDRWYCVSLSRIGSTLKAYVDAVQIANVSNSTDLGTSGDSYFGIQACAGGIPPPCWSWDHAFDGELAIMRWYNRGLTDAEVLQNYDAMRYRFNL